MKDDQDVTQEQAFKASDYIAGYFKMMGWQYPYDMPETDEEVAEARLKWPKDVVAALDVCIKYSEQLKEDGVIV